MPYLEPLGIGLDGFRAVLPWRVFLLPRALQRFLEQVQQQLRSLAELLFRTCWKMDTTGVWLLVLSRRVVH